MYCSGLLVVSDEFWYNERVCVILKTIWESYFSASSMGWLLTMVSLTSWNCDVASLRW